MDTIAAICRVPMILSGNIRMKIGRMVKITAYITVKIINKKQIMSGLNYGVCRCLTPMRCGIIINK